VRFAHKAARTLVNSALAMGDHNSKRSTLSEEEFTKGVLIPMLHHVGYQRIRYVHGHDEHGRDLVFFDIDRLGNEALHAAQVKLGNIKGSEKRKIQTEIVPQLLEGLRQPYRDPETGKTHYVTRMYLILSGEIGGTAKDQIHALLEREPNIVALDRQTIDLLVSRDGIETMFGISSSRGEVGMSTGTPGRLPRLPLLMPGMTLEVPVEVTEAGFYRDHLEIAYVSYSPVFRTQTVYLLIEKGTHVSHNKVLDEVYESLRRTTAFLWEYWEMASEDHSD
jgi:hypothetical protein